jgi:branched-chain amino acid transport system permease protein
MGLLPARGAQFRTSHRQFSDLFASPLQVAGAALAALLLVCLPLVANSYVLSFATLILITATGTVGFNILVGWTGLVSLGYSGFYALGAYVNAILMLRYGWSFLAAVPAAALGCGAASLLVGLPSLRLKGLYLAITTLAFSIIVNQLILVAKPLTGGSGGMTVPRPMLFGIDLTGDNALFWLCALVFGLVLLLAANIRRSFLGRALFAVRDYEVAARVLGVNVVRTKLISFAISSGIIGLAGAMFSFDLQYLNVDSFDLLLSIEAISMVIVGGLGHTAGAVLGAAFMVLLPEAIRVSFNLMSSGMAALLQNSGEEVKGVIDGAIIVIFLRAAPAGLIGLVRAMWRALTRWPLLR